ncbi:aromatic ring-hydroxylating dioxygenase subunit alpha [Saccharopolyspora phatthalungensis]|uniref:Phenylpropionate dioxygenase-like ring-hydroxylating dioxygenase large terminal subunit n=1 Tax=Saccharopolyspora phatthalungensis TaxID=664693 RepID=A0A840QFZ8_9PSEU|nr:aromatic ring-hydroxylating dioxygenase subunit alpha [Saccharopolyspora phatthalungensis]MBB5158870.1 phenylpropionate dioxygenase-like ring-hydroxylating dioxygenase large terminal subunit [Saccharopolyspora phatthalungensis]
MLLNFWYALAFSDRVSRSPLRVQALDQQIVLYRAQDGAAVAMSDLCVHRGGALSLGRVEGDSIVCPFHGWTYGRDGVCTRIPAQADARIPAKAKVDSYPVQERYGLVWVFLGDLPEDQRPPLPNWPECEDPKYRSIRGEYRWQANYDRVVESSIDFAHIPFVHGASLKESIDAKVSDVELTEWSGEADAWQDGYGRFSWHLPCMNRVVVPYGRESDIAEGKVRHTLIIFQAHVPVSEEVTHTNWIALRKPVAPVVDRVLDWVFQRTMKNFSDQDARIVENQRPQLLPFDLADELHIRADALQVAYRRRRRQLIEQGWPMVDSQAGRADSVKVIGSPARRADQRSSSWVHRSQNETPNDPSTQEERLFEKTSGPPNTEHTP